jgi:quinoprotein glucose dehydrogenase
LWDYDVPAQPVLATVRRDGQDIPAVVVATKMGHLFVLDRETGEPLLPVEERMVAPSDVPGEEAWPTQPFPLRPPPLVPQRLTADDAWGADDAEREACRRRLQGLRSEGIFTPPSLEGTVIFPGNIGGFHWGGVAVDPERGIAVGPTNRLATMVRLVPREEYDEARRRSRSVEISPQRGTGYGMARAFVFSPKGLPCNPPPWGTLSAVELATGEVKWEVPLGFFPALENHPGSRRWGSVNLGGAMMTAGGLVFIAATHDRRLRAFDIETGEEVWSAELPAGGNATPMSYELDGRQYVVIAAGGHGRLGTKQGDYLMAYALPRPGVPQPSKSAAVEGLYQGELIIERTRYAARLELRRTPEGSLTGELRTREPAITGALAGFFSEGSLDYTIAFAYPEKSCQGVMRGVAELANHGAMLVGEVHVSGECSGTEPELGTMALRKQGR